jgi:hypothetical protein
LGSAPRASAAGERSSATRRSARSSPGGDRIEAHKDTILELVEETPDIAIEELRQALAEKSATIGYGTIRRSPRDHAKKETAHAAEQDRPDIVKRREA